jgi:hypothetical protein
LPTQLTTLGRRKLAQATGAVKSVEDRMLNGLVDSKRVDARRMLSGFISSLHSES